MSDGLDRQTENGTSYLTGGGGPAVVFLHCIPSSQINLVALSESTDNPLQDRPIHAV